MIGESSHQSGLRFAAFEHSDTSTSRETCSAVHFARELTRTGVLSVNIEFQITTPDQSISALVMGRAQVPRGTEIELTNGARLFYMGREPRGSGAGKAAYVYSFALRIPHEIAVGVGTSLVWDLVTRADRAALISRVGILTREATVDVDPRNPEGKRAIATAIEALQRFPIPAALWLGE